MKFFIALALLVTFAFTVLPAAAQAPTEPAPPGTSPSPTMPQDPGAPGGGVQGGGRQGDNDRDWGWVGLLGLLGLAGRMRRGEERVRTESAYGQQPRTTTTPR